MAEKLNDRAVKALPIPANGNRVTYDSEIKGFGVRVTAAGARAFVLNYRVAGRERRITIGSYPDWSTSAARDEAKALKQQIDRGEDPLAEREAQRTAPTMNELIQQFKEDYLPRKRPSTIAQYTLILDKHVAPKLGPKKVEDITHPDIDALHRAISRRSPIQANRAMAVLSKIFSWAMKREIRTDNPVQGIERNAENKRSRYLTQEEIAYLLDALAIHPEQASANAIRLLMLTGARRTEVLAATWGMFDLKAALWVKPSAHTKQKKEHRTPLSAPALSLLTAMKADAERRAAEDKKALSEFLFPSETDRGHQADLKKSWASVTQRATVSMWAAGTDTPPGQLVAELNEQLGCLPSYTVVVKLAGERGINLPPGLTDVRVHDLRHTFASILASSGASLPLIGALLGHTQAATTHRYAHLFDDPLRAATERVGALVTGAAGGKGAEVVPFRRES